MSNNNIAVVLGSGLNADGSATSVTLLRAKAAAEFLRQKRMKLILSGSRPPDDHGEHGKTEAAVMAEIVASEGISRKRLLLEDQSFDTLGNAVFTVRRYLSKRKPGTLYVVTSPFHMERAIFIFRHVLGPSWKVVGHEAPECPNENRQPGAPAAMQRARDFVEGIAAGDLDACEKRLFERIPAYKNRAQAA